jgi:hypothetical protein
VGDVAALDAWAAERSFDISAAPGLGLAGREIWNDLPLVSFASNVQPAAEATDALATELAPLLAGRAHADDVFDVAPITDDRPYVFAILRPSKIHNILARLELVPREEIGLLINFAVLIQALVLAIVVLLLPVVRRASFAFGRAPLGRTVTYFFSLGLGFLFIEIFLIEKATALLADRATAFAVVLAGMLVFSGLGSAWSSRFEATPRRTLGLACLVIALWGGASFVSANPVLVAASGLSTPLRLLLLVAWIAPVGIALGFPFSVGLTCLRDHGQLVPWAWSLNGAASVIATPLANLLAVSAGLGVLVITGVLLYAVVWRSLPVVRGH